MRNDSLNDSKMSSAPASLAHLAVLISAPVLGAKLTCEPSCPDGVCLCHLGDAPVTHCNALLVHVLPRRRDDAMQAHRASFVATPTAELSNQEETLLGDILDWSLDTSCSGYEGDQEEESEGEKDSDCEC